MRFQKTMRTLLWTAFVFYSMALVYILLLNARSGRYPGESLGDYISFSVNLVPFKTISDYIVRLREDSMNFSTVVLNIFGNLILFFPMGIFLPCLFEKIKKLWQTALITFCMILCAEILQLLLCRGIFDIDDFLLNMAGCVLGFGITRIPFVHAWLKKLCLLPRERDVSENT